MRADNSGRRFKPNIILRAGDFLREPCKATGAIAAHFRFATIAIIVSHSKIGPILRFFEQQNPIRTHSGMSVANPGNLRWRKPNITGAIVDHDKIVAGAVHFDEAQHHVDSTTNGSSDKERRLALP